MTTIKVRRDTTANWASVNPVLAEGEQGMDTDLRVLKLGDGSTVWSGLTGYPVDPAALRTALGTGYTADLTASYAPVELVAHDFSTDSNGAPPTLVDTGQPLVNFQNIAVAAPIISSGYLTYAPTGSLPAAGYTEIRLGGAATEFSGTFRLITANAGVGGSVGMNIFKTTILRVLAAVPDSPCHLSITKTGWNYSVWENGSIAGLDSGTFATALSLDTDYDVSVSISGSTATVTLPDATTATVTDERIARFAGQYLDLETYNGDASVGSFGGWRSMAAKATVPKGQNLARATTAAISAAKPSIFIPKHAFFSQTGSPADTTAGGHPVWALDASSAESVACELAEWLPYDWYGHPITAMLVWTNQSTGTGDVRWIDDFVEFGAGGTMSIAAFGGTGSGQITATAPAQNVIAVSQLSSGLVFAAAKFPIFRVSRGAANVADTLANDASVRGVVMSLT